MEKEKTGVEWLWDAWCVASVIGIWPRYIEPRLLSTTRLSLPIPNLPRALIGLKVLQFSDLHWHERFCQSLKVKLVNKIKRLKPDLIVFTGDLLCRSRLEGKKALKDLLGSLQAPLGCYAILGNHDYDQFATVNSQGDYDIERPSSRSIIGKGFKRLLSSAALTKQWTKEVLHIQRHQELLSFFKETPFQVLMNETKLLNFQGAYLNLCGLEEYTLGRFDPEQAFQNYQAQYPGIILSHNPDTLPILKDYPGELILLGHTHGGQVNLPFLWKKFTGIECLQFKRGLKRLQTKWAYINRGIGSVLPFRWFSLPELTLITLQQA